MTDRDFDQLLYQGADQLPPKSVEQTSPDPWRQALLLICWGIALTSITLNFLNLQYILPAVGAMLLCLGFRSLRRENGWFRQCYVLSILLALYRGATDLLLATPLAADLSGGWSYLLGLLGWLVSLWLLFALWRALKAVFLRAELPAKTRAAGGMVICYFLLFLLALVNASGWLLLLPVLILWICLLTGLFKTSRALDHAGYAIQPAPVRLSNGRVLAVSLGALLLAALACLLIFSRYPVEASATQLETGQKELRQELLGLGFPEEVLADLTDQEVALLDGADAVMVKSDLSRWDTRHESTISLPTSSRWSCPMIWCAISSGSPGMRALAAAFGRAWRSSQTGPTKPSFPPPRSRAVCCGMRLGSCTSPSCSGSMAIRPKAASSSEPAATSPSASTSPCPGVGNTSVAMSPMRPGCRSRN